MPRTAVPRTAVPLPVCAACAEEMRDLQMILLQRWSTYVICPDCDVITPCGMDTSRLWHGRCNYPLWHGQTVSGGHGG